MNTPPSPEKTPEHPHAPASSTSGDVSGGASGDVSGGFTHQPPYDEAQYARFQPEPWDDDAPAPTGNAHRVWYGFIALSVVMMITGALLMLTGVACLNQPQAMLAEIQKAAQETPQGILANSKDMTAADIRQFGRIYLMLGGIYLFGFGAIFLFPRNVYKWGYGIVLILLTALSCFFAPFALVMLIFWLLPSTRQYFQNQPSR